VGCFFLKPGFFSTLLQTHVNWFSTYKAVHGHTVKCIHFMIVYEALQNSVIYPEKLGHSGCK